MQSLRELQPTAHMSKQLVYIVALEVEPSTEIFLLKASFA